MDEEPEAPEAPEGRLHGHTLRILGIVSVAAAVLAVALFSPAMFSGDDEEASATWPWQEPSTAVFTDDEETSSATAASSVDATTSSAAPSPESATSEPEPETSEPEAPTSSAAPERTEEPEPEGATCTATLRLEDEWDGNVQVKVTVVNTGGEITSGWEVTIAIDDVEVYHSWGMRHAEGDRYRNEDWNGVLDPGEDTVGTFQAETDGEPDLPESVPCKAFA